jgi:DNA-binding NtrC family response regulator
MSGLAAAIVEEERHEIALKRPRTGPDDAWPTVFVVDDDECLRALVGDWVEDAGFRAVRLPGGEACLAALASGVPSAVILDLHMWGMSGASTLDAIRATHPDVPVIAMTGESDPATAVDMIERGASEFLTKPVPRSQHCRARRGASRHRAAQRPVQ